MTLKKLSRLWHLWNFTEEVLHRPQSTGQPQKQTLLRLASKGAGTNAAEWVFYLK